MGSGIGQARGTRTQLLAGLLAAAVAAVAMMAPPALAAPANDDASSAEIITSLPFTTQQPTADASASTSDPELTGAACPAVAHATMWYRYTSARSAPVRLDTSTSDYDTVLAVFVQGAQGLEQVACNNTAGESLQARVTLDMTAGTSYLVMVGATDATSSGTVGLTIEETALPPLALSISVEREAPLVPRSGEVLLRGTATCSRPAALNVSGWVEQDASATWVNQYIDCPGYAVAWSAVSRDRQGTPLHAGAARADLVVHAFDDADAVTTTQETLRLRGPRVAFARSVSEGGHDPFRTEIFTAAENGAGVRRLTTNTVEDNHPTFSPDGRRIAFTSARRGKPSIYVMHADGSRVRRLTRSSASDSMPDWSPDGKWIVFTRHFAKQRQSDLLKVRVADRATRRLTRTRARELRPSWSPDGTQIAFTKLVDAKERYGIAVVRPAGTRARWLTQHPRSRAGRLDSSPTWSPGSTHVAFAREGRRGASEIFTVARNGTRVRRLTATGGAAQLPSWGADGRMVLVLNGRLATMDPDGSRVRMLAADRAVSRRPYGFPDWAHAVTE